MSKKYTLKISGIAGKDFKFGFDDGIHTVGRGTTNTTIVTPSEYEQISRTHFELRAQNGQFSIRDTGSSLGTTVQGQAATDWMPVPAGRAFKVGPYDAVIETGTVIVPTTGSGSVATQPDSKVALWAILCVCVVAMLTMAYFAYKMLSKDQTGSVTLASKVQEKAREAETANDRFHVISLEDAEEATILIEAIGGVESGGMIQREVGTGSGFLVGDQTTIATNYHVVEPFLIATANDMRAQLSVVFNAGKKGERLYPARVLKVDPTADLALIEVADDDYRGGQNKYFQLGNSDEVELKEELTLFGFPLTSVFIRAEGKIPSASVVSLEVQNIKKDNEDRPVQLQVSGAAAPGHSGGPVFDGNFEIKGILVGALNAELTSSDIRFAIPSNRLKPLLVKHLATKKARAEDKE